MTGNVYMNLHMWPYIDGSITMAITINPTRVMVFLETFFQMHEPITTFHACCLVLNLILHTLPPHM